MATKKNRSRALEEMHETARGLHKAGVITKRRMKEYDALCNLEIAEITPERIKALREQAHLSQSGVCCRAQYQHFYRPEVGDRRQKTQWSIFETSKHHRQ
ncbi:MAG: transcriptional regulator [Desulfurivibrio sp.]|nr:transcriptional regulator [Desulfurivibrio sp.]